ncbi:MAG TPA: hypothetical protein VKZ63_16685 [Kofleriaceae bacterium]|nr:hypothetical protein [Kofleriaceae bacterium]
MRAPLTVQAGSLALTRVAAFTVAVEADRIAGLLEPGEREADADLAELIGAAAGVGAPSRLLELHQAGGRVVLALHGPVRLQPSEVTLRCHRPALIAGVLRRAHLKGVVRHEGGFAFLLDVDRIAARPRARAGEEEACASG